MLEAFVKHFPQPLNPAMEARNKLSAIAAKSGDMGGRDYWLKEIIAADRSAGAARTDRSRAWPPRRRSRWRLRCAKSSCASSWWYR